MPLSMGGGAMQNNSDRLLGIDLARIAAAWMVMLFHLAYHSWANEGTPASILRGGYAYPELALFSSFGWVGVQIFFVISGLVIARSAEGSTAWQFANNRFLRLFPGALVCASITLIVAILIDWKPLPELLDRYVRSVLFIPIGPWIDGVYWTLAIEIAFYSLVAGLLLIRCPHLIENTVFAVGLVSAASILFGLPSSRLNQFLLLPHGVYFALGCTLWFAHKDGWSRRRILTLLILSAVGLVPLGIQAGLVWGATIAAMAVTLYAGTLSVRMPQMASSAIKTLSLSTYPLYLTHQLVGAAVLRCFSDFGINRFAALFAACALMLALGVVITIGPERTIRRRIRRYTARISTTVSPIPPIT